jgi:hypothetical protein
MNCKNGDLVAGEENYFYLWKMAFDDVFTDLKNIYSYNLNDAKNKFIRYFDLLGSHLNKNTNNYCVFLDQCPNLFLEPEFSTFRSGFYTLPISAIYYEHLKKDTTVLQRTTDKSENALFKTKFNNYQIGNRDRSNVMITDFLVPKSPPNYSYTVHSSGYSIMDSLMKSKLNTLDDLIFFINNNIGKNVFHVIIVAACTAESKNHKDYEKYQFTDALSKFKIKFSHFLLKLVNTDLVTDATLRASCFREIPAIGSTDHESLFSQEETIKINKINNSGYLVFQSRDSFFNVDFTPAFFTTSPYINQFTFNLNGSSFQLYKKGEYIIIKKAQWQNHPYFKIDPTPHFEVPVKDCPPEFFQDGGTTYLKIGKKKYKVFLRNSMPHIKMNKKEVHIKDVIRYDTNTTSTKSKKKQK